MLQLALTDGVQERQATEYRTIPMLNVNLMPGVKLRLIGPITVRTSWLTSHVGELLVANAAENVLAKHLNLPLNPNPQQIEQTAIVEEIRIEPTRNAQDGFNQRQLITEDERMIAEEIDCLLETEREHLNENRASNQIVTTMTANGLNDDFFDDIDIDAHLNQVDKIVDNDDDNKQRQKQETKSNLITIKKLLENKNCIGLFKIKAKFKGIAEKITMTERDID